ncbi:intradiol ring-cleavage dioxygenase [Corynebacterium lubricantis]|uniref:intradiol ring-cleavage dioxygenase n=1 Tax=Corynebacterium lubricantis TaxID=541095 RepID=UPI000360FC48|nr:intradiol ring-cleavage dioxygenase [Corynebacterium lubricantis]
MAEQLREYEGRVLPNQSEDLEDQGLGFDIGTVFSRRKMLGFIGLGGAGIALAACSSTAASIATTSSAASDASTTSSAAAALAEMKSETEGPYPGDGSNGPDVLEISGVERRDITKSIDTDTVAEGIPLSLTMTLVDMSNNNQPMEGAAVYIWHCDAPGRYSMYDTELQDETYLRGVQVADKYGQVTFDTIFPGCYAGRWVHIHFEVFPDRESITDSTNNILTSQIAFDEASATSVYALDVYGNSMTNLNDMSLESDNVFSDGWDQQMATITGDTTKGFEAGIEVPIDPTTEQDQSMSGGAGEPGGAGGPSGGMPPGQG